MRNRLEAGEVMALDKRFMASFVMIAVIGLSFGALLGSSVGSYFANVGEASGWSGRVVIEVERPSGIETILVHNVVTVKGKDMVIDSMRAGRNNFAENGAIYISLSNDASPDNTWTKLPNEVTGSGLARAAGTATDVSEIQYTVSKKFTASATVTVQCAGLNWVVTSNSDNNLWAAATFAGTTLNANDNITVTWTVTHN